MFKINLDVNIVFVISCIKEWLNYNNICPYCRQPIKDVYMIDYKPDLS